MQFNSLYFILFFLPLLLGGYYIVARKNKEAADWLLIGASFLFYGMTNAWYPLMLALLIALNWGIACGIRKGKKSGKRRMIAGIVLNAAVLGIFKYTNFFIENLNAALKTDWPLVNLILPLGISFIIFSQISFIVDVYRGDAADINLREYVLFSCFFPKLSQGPITLLRDFLPELRKPERHTLNEGQMVIGIQMFVCGLAKKIFIADALGVGVDYYFDTITYRTNVESFLLILAYTFQIYFDFSGYSDMALGISKMLGFYLPANFNSPYKATTITDFWRRWHISLTTFLREYIYFPLGGSKKGRIRTYVNIMIVYLVSGLWHGASWGYVLWGIFHGLAQVVERLLGKVYLKVFKGVRWLITMALVAVLWVLFRCGTWEGFMRFRWHLIIERTWVLSVDFMQNFHVPGVETILSLLGLSSETYFVSLLSMVLLFVLCFLICLLAPNNQERTYKATQASAFVTAVLLIACMLSLSGVSTFIYNDF